MGSMFTIKNLGRILGLVAAVLVLGCANPVPQPPTTTTDTTKALRSLEGTNLNLIDSTQWRCPLGNASNIKLKGNVDFGNRYNYTGSNDYEACADRSNQPIFKISGGSWSTFCVFPMYFSSTGSLIKMTEMYQCFAHSDQAITVTFNSPEINHLIIVNASYSSQLLACLSGSASCPPYSDGMTP
jgi:hypothetical protein